MGLPRHRKLLSRGFPAGELLVLVNVDDNFQIFFPFYRFAAPDISERMREGEWERERDGANSLSQYPSSDCLLLSTILPLRSPFYLMSASSVSASQSI